MFVESKATASRAALPQSPQQPIANDITRKLSMVFGGEDALPCDAVKVSEQLRVVVLLELAFPRPLPPHFDALIREHGNNVFLSVKEFSQRFNEILARLKFFDDG